MRMNPTATATIVLVAVFAGGMLAGMLVERAILAPPAAEASPLATSPRPGSAQDRDRIAAELGLTAEQRERIDEILDEQQREIQAIMRETRPRTRQVVKDTRARIEEVLTPEQQARFEAMHAEMHRARAERPAPEHR
jgi:Spy/CpxP family protein refolding chaperone